MKIKREKGGRSMKMKKCLFPAVFIVAAAGVVNAASASVITYGDRTTWTAAAGTPDFTVDFESFASDTSFASAPLDVGPFTLSTNGTAQAGRNIVDVTPFMFTGVPASFGNATTDIYVEGPSLTADLTFDTGVRAFFADFLNAGNTSELDLTLSFAGGGNADVLVPGPGNQLVPFGFISTTDTITTIRFNNSVNDGFYIDNISASVPEPSTLALLGLGLATFGFRRRCKAN
jgi:hypothetical protein